MFISTIQSVDTGGHVKIEELKIENGGDLKVIGVSEDCIVGYSTNSILEAKEEHELFVCYTKKSLEMHVAAVVATIAWGLFTGGEFDE